MRRLSTRRLAVCGIGIAALLCSGALGDEKRQTRFQPLKLSKKLRQRCLLELLKGLNSEEFWPSIHAAEALTLAGQGAQVRRILEPKLKTETDDQKRCGISRELVRAGDATRAGVMLKILAGKDPHGHVHAAESLYKVSRIGDGEWMRKRFSNTRNERLKIMAAAALGKCGNPAAMAHLRKAIAHEDMELARTAAWVLARIGDASGHSEVTAALETLQRRSVPGLFPARVGQPR